LPEFILKIVKNNGIINFLQKNDFNALKWNIEFVFYQEMG
jgi:hypothetical protein